MWQKVKRWVIIIGIGLLTVEFLLVGGFKLAGSPPLIQMFEDFGLPVWFMYFTGTLEVSCGIGLLFYRHWVGFIAALLLMATMISATGFHLYFDPFSKSIFTAILALLTGLIAYNRRHLLPLIREEEA